MMPFDFTRQPGLTQIKPNITEPLSVLISIITPYYNAKEYFGQTYNCVINQTFPWFEWVIIDDGSTEDAEYLETIKEKDIRIKLIRQENLGQAAARNKGVDLATADIIIPLDADDLIIPTYLELSYWVLKKEPSISWCYMNSVGFQEKEYLWEKSFSAERLKYNNFLTCTAAIRKSSLLKIGGYDSSNSHYDEDWKLWLDLLASGAYPAHLNVIGFWYRRTSKGMANQVRLDKSLSKQSNALISQAADKVDPQIKAIEYPLTNVTNRFLAPVLSEFQLQLPDKSKKHILMIFPWLEMGGADLFNLEVVKKLDKKIYNITIITTVSSANTWRQRFDEYVPEIFSMPDFADPTEYPEFISYILKTRQTDLLFLSNSYYCYYLLPWIRNNFPDLSVCDYVHMEEWYWRNGGYARISGIFSTFIDKTYVCNNKTRDVLIKFWNRLPNAVKTLYIGVDSQYYSPQSTKKGLVYQMFSINSSRPIILFPCRIHPQKRPFLMVRIAEKLKKLGNPAAFVVVGDGPQLGELKDTVTQLGLEKTVYFAGRQNDLRPFYADAAVTLICSLKEGLALTAYESLAMETPVITSNVGGQSELINDSVGAVIPLLQEENISLDKREFIADEVALYVNTLSNLLAIENQEQYKILCGNCRNRILEGFSTDIMIQTIEKEFELLINRPPKPTAFERLDIKLLEEFNILYTEYELLEKYAKDVSQPLDTKNELIRIANSKWGRRLIKLAFKLKLNKLIR